MTFEKWTEKAVRLLEASENVLFIQNTDKGGYFALNKYVVYFLEHQSICSAVKKGTFQFDALFDMCNDAEAATVKREKVDGKNILRLSAGDKSSAVQEKFARVFPKNAIYSISKGKRSPVLVSLMDGGALHPIAVIMPILV